MREQHLGAVGFGDVVVGTQIEGSNLVELGVEAGEHDDADVAFLAQRAAQHAAVGAGQHGVHDDAVGFCFQDLRDGIGKVAAAFDAVAFRCKQAGKLAAQRGVVFDDENQGHIHSK